MSNNFAKFNFDVSDEFSNDDVQNVSNGLDADSDGSSQDRGSRSKGLLGNLLNNNSMSSEGSGSEVSSIVDDESVDVNTMGVNDSQSADDSSDSSDRSNTKNYKNNDNDDSSLYNSSSNNDSDNFSVGDKSGVSESVVVDSDEGVSDSVVDESEPVIRFNFDKPRSSGSGVSGGVPRFGFGADVRGSFGVSSDVSDDFDADSFSDDFVSDDFDNDFDGESFGVRSLVLDDEDELESVGFSEDQESENDVIGISASVGGSVSDSVGSRISSGVDSSSVSDSSLDVVGELDGSGIVNPFLVDDFDDEDEVFVGDFSSDVSGNVGVVSDEIDDVSGVDGSDSSLSGSGSSRDSGSAVLRDELEKVADREVFDESRGNDDRGSASVDSSLFDTVVVNRRRGSRGVSGFSRESVSEVVVDDVSGVDGSDSSVGSRSGSAVGVSSERKRNRHIRENGRLNGKELEFFKNLGSSKSSIDSERLSLLRGRVDGVSSVAARKARNVLYSQAIGGSELLKRGSKVRFGERDRDTLQLLALFRYMTASHIARAFSQSVRTSQDRLRKLRSQGLVIDKKIFGTDPIWFLTEAGMLLSGYDLTRVTESGLKFNMFPHQFTVNHVAANVWGANVNVLNLKDFPSRNRLNEKGDRVFGESLTSELEIQSVLSKMRGMDKADTFVPVLKGNIDVAFTRWERSGGVEFGPSPEMVLGNEYMWALFPPSVLRLAYHVPDLVVKRDRNPDGSPESIAVEIEINNKASDRYEKTLRAFRADDRIYKKVIWVCKSVGPARKLEKIGKDLGLIQEGRLEILPVLTEDGVFKGRDLWTL